MTNSLRSFCWQLSPALLLFVLDLACQNRCNLEGSSIIINLQLQSKIAGRNPLLQSMTYNHCDVRRNPKQGK